MQFKNILEECGVTDCCVVAITDFDVHKLICTTWLVILVLYSYL